MESLKAVLFGTLPLDLNRATGGVEAVSINLLSGFAEVMQNDPAAAPAEIHWISFSNEVKTYRKITYTDGITLHYIPIRYRKFQLIDYFFNRKELNRILKTVRPDVIHVQGASPHLLRLSAYPKKKIVVTQHGIMQVERSLVTGWKNKLKFAFKLLVETYYFPRFQHFIFISEYNKQLFNSKKPFHSELIRNPVNPLFFTEPKELQTPLRLIYVGWISQLKNLGLLLETLAELREKGIVFQLTVVGAFKEAGYKAMIEQLVKEKELDSQLRFTGMLPQKAVFAALQESDVLVVPSLQENLPVSIAEAMAMGKVVIASRVGAIPEMIEHGVSGLLFDKGNGGQLAQLLSDLHEKRTDASAMARTAKTAATAQYGPEAIARQTIAFYKNMNQHG